MSTTRLLILGAVRIFQPVHGYLVRSELVSWEVDRWAHLNPGSVYNALRTLSRDGYLSATISEPGPAGAARTSYALTDNGEVEFLSLLRSAFMTVDVYAADSLMAGVAFMWALPRAEVLTLLSDRLAQIALNELGLDASLEQIRCDEGTPEHVQELKHLVFARMRGETEWTRALIQRINDGAYAFEGEPVDRFFRLDPRYVLQ